MPQRSKVDSLMKEKNISRTAANNVFRKKGNGLKDSFSIRKTKRRSISK